jgi:hypothetical protein
MIVTDREPGYVLGWSSARIRGSADEVVRVEMRASVGFDATNLAVSGTELRRELKICFMICGSAYDDV